MQRAELASLIQIQACVCQCRLRKESWQRYRPRRSSIHFTRLHDSLQQVRNRGAACIRHEAYHSGRAGVNVDAVRLRENGITSDNVERSGDSAAAENKKPGLSFG